MVPAGLDDVTGVEARVGAQGERAGRPGAPAPSDELSDEALRTPSRSRRALAEPDVEDLARVGSRREQRVVAEDVGVAEGGALLLVAVHRADRRVHVDRHRPGAGSRARRPRPCEHRLGELVELTDVAEVEAPQEGPEGGGCHHLVGKDRTGRPGAQHVGVIDAVRPGDHGVHERRDPAPRERGDVDELLGERFQTETRAQHADEREAGISDRVVVVEHHGQTRRTVRG